MANRNPEFWILGVVAGQYCHVIGRCGDDPIRRGDVFTTMFRYQRARSPKDYACSPPREEERPVSLVVKTIHAFDKELREMGPGMIGSLVLDGDDGRYLDKGWVLGIGAARQKEANVTGTSTGKRG